VSVVTGSAARQVRRPCGPYARAVTATQGDAAHDWTGVRLHVVSGKGGTGKTTVAAALALALAHGGRKVLVVEVEGRQGLSQIYDVPPLPYAERKVATAPGGGEVFALAIDPEEALLEYLEMFYNLRRAGTALRRMGAIDFATTIAPGVRDVLLTGKAKEAVRRKNGNKHVYDAVVMDAPPTGRIARFLNVNSEVAGLARTGPIRSQADAVMDVIASPLTAVHLVTLLEEMPVQETADAVLELTRSKPPTAAAGERPDQGAQGPPRQGRDRARSRSVRRRVRQRRSRRVARRRPRRRRRPRPRDRGGRARRARRTRDT
jgi:Anion-transporting ATPase